MTPTPEGQITSTETWLNNLIKKVEENPEMAEALADAEAQEVVQEVVPVLEEEQLPEVGNVELTD